MKLPARNQDQNHLESEMEKQNKHQRALEGELTEIGVLVVTLRDREGGQHRIVEGGRATPRIVAASSRLAAAALLPFALSLGIDLYIVFGLRFGPAIGIVTASS